MISQIPHKSFLANTPALVLSILLDIEALREQIIFRDPESSLCWICKSTLQLAQQLREKSQNIFHKNEKTHNVCVTSFNGTY